MKNPQSTRFAVLLDGALTATARVKHAIEGCRILAADGGIRHAEALGVTPELWIGDFDSADQHLIDHYVHVPRQNHVPDKAMSDGEIAIRHALDCGADSLLLCGGIGGERTDHAFFNLATAIDLAKREEIDVVVTSGAEEALPLVPGTPLKPDWTAGTMFSIMNFSNLEGLTITAAKWPLHDVNVRLGSTLTLSNVAANNVAIVLSKGCAVAIAQVECQDEGM